MQGRWVQIRNLKTSTKLVLGDQEKVGMFVAGSLSGLCSSQFIGNVVFMKSRGLNT
jgi:hypothetical protein